MAQKPLLYRELSKKQRLIRGALTAFTLYHLLAMLIGGAIKQVKRPFAPVLEAYDEGFRMVNSWGMFGKAPSSNHVVLEATMRDGQTVLLSTTNAGERGTFERIRDVRIRKIQGKLTDNGDRARWGPAYMDYFCRLARQQYGDNVASVRATELIHEKRNLDEKVVRTASTKLAIAKDCSVGPKQGIDMPFRPGIPDLNDPSNL
jgi:hypothetical protein